MIKRVTYGQLYQLLLDLEFVDQQVQQPWKAYRHGDTDTLILLANRNQTLPARDSDLFSVRRYLVDNGLMEESDFEGFLSHGRLSRSR